MHDISTLTVGLGTRAYDISVGRGLIARADDLIGAFLNDRHVVVISDSNVAPVHLPALMAACARVGRRCDTIEVPAGESSKSMPVLAKLLEDILALGVDRGVVLVALGGGVIGDLVGFAAASLLRGVDFIQVPTTLLAQVDSSVGGKTGVNAAAGKNLIGAFHQPRAVLADLAALDTLADRELRAGYAEVVKYGLLGDAAFFEWLEAHGGSVLARDDASLRHAVTVSCEAKARIVEADERDTDRGAHERLSTRLLNGRIETFSQRPAAWKGSFSWNFITASMGTRLASATSAADLADWRSAVFGVLAGVVAVAPALMSGEEGRRLKAAMGGKTDGSARREGVRRSPRTRAKGE